MSAPRPAAVVFDFDGLILDTEWPIYAAAREIFVDHDLDLSFELWQGFIGRVDHPHWSEILEDSLGRAVDREALEARYQPRRAQLIEALPVLPGIVDLVDELCAHDVPIAVASSSSGPWVSGHLRRLGLLARFSVIHTGDQVTHRKPAPDLYRLAADSLGVDASAAVAIEDSLTGCAAATAAGMKVVAIPSRMTVGMDFSGADLVVESAVELDVSLLGALIRSSGGAGAA